MQSCYSIRIFSVVASFWGTEMIRFLGPEGKPRSTVLIVNFVGGWNTAWYVKGRFCRELLNMMNMSKCHFQPQFIVDKERHVAHRGTYGLWYPLMHHDITPIIISQTPTYWNVETSWKILNSMARSCRKWAPWGSSDWRCRVETSLGGAW